MDGLLAWIVGCAALGGIGGVAGSAVLMAAPDARRRAAVGWLLAYASGTLLGSALLAMLPRALAEAPAPQVCATLLGGIVAFFLLEKTMLWRHEHGPAAGPAPTGPLILIGDGFHNFVDGVVIAAAFLTSVPLGIAATVAVIAHEIPQEVGDYAVLLDSGYGPWRAFLLNGLSAAATLPGALAGYLWLPQVSDAVPYVLALSAASFVYIAMADLLPMLRRWNAPWRNLLQLALLFAGIATIALMAAP